MSIREVKNWGIPSQLNKNEFKLSFKVIEKIEVINFIWTPGTSFSLTHIDSDFVYFIYKAQNPFSRLFLRKHRSTGKKEFVQELELELFYENSSVYMNHYIDRYDFKERNFLMLAQIFSSVCIVRMRTKGELSKTYVSFNFIQANSTWFWISKLSAVCAIGFSNGAIVITELVAETGLPNKTPTKAVIK